MAQSCLRLLSCYLFFSSSFLGAMESGEGAKVPLPQVDVQKAVQEVEKSWGKAFVAFGKEHEQLLKLGCIGIVTLGGTAYILHKTGALTKASDWIKKNSGKSIVLSMGLVGATTFLGTAHYTGEIDLKTEIKGIASLVTQKTDWVAEEYNKYPFIPAIGGKTKAAALGACVALLVGGIGYVVKEYVEFFDEKFLSKHKSTSDNPKDEVGQNSSENAAHYYQELTTLAESLSQENEELEAVSTNPNQSRDVCFPVGIQTQADNPMTEEFIDRVFFSAPEKLQKRVMACLQQQKNPTGCNSKPPFILLLDGPSATGKSTLAQVIARKLGRPFLFLSAGALSNHFAKSGRRNLDTLFDPLLRSGKPCVIILDEINTLFNEQDKEHTKSDADEGTVTEFWVLLDRCAKQRNVLVIATTNDIKNIPIQLQTRYIKNNRFYIDDIGYAAKKWLVKDCLGSNYTITNWQLYWFMRKIRHLYPREIESILESAASYADYRNQGPNRPHPEKITIADLHESFKDFKESEHAMSNYFSIFTSLKQHVPWIIQSSLSAGLSIYLNHVQLSLQKTLHDINTVQANKFHKEQTKKSDESLDHAKKAHADQPTSRFWNGFTTVVSQLVVEVIKYGIQSYTGTKIDTSSKD